MASPKTKKRPARASAKKKPAPLPALFSLKYAPSLLGLLAGQAFFFRGHQGQGILLSLLSVLLAAALYHFSFPGFKPKGAVRKPSAPKFDLKKTWPFLGALTAILLAVLGQLQWIHPEGGSATLWKGLWFYLAAVLVFLFSFRKYWKEGLQQEPLAPRVEWTAFGLIMAVALFYRLYLIRDIPAGIFIDEGFAGYGALKVLHEGWRFFYLPEPHQHASLFIYLIALWFTVFSPTAVHFTLFSVFMGVASLPFIYWTYRQWAGPRVALVGLFILSVMRWNINFTRNSQRTELMPLFMFASISLFLYGYRNQKRWAYLTSAFFLGAGLYTYQSYKIFPFLFFLYLFYELVANPKKFKASLRNLALAAGLFLLIASPLIHLMIQWRSIGPREASISMMAKVQEEHSLRPLIQNTIQTALMFNRVGDPNPRHNLSNYRMLDDVTGVLFVLGVFYALAHIVRRKYFYALAGLGVMTLPCLLSTDAAHANRMMGTTPFICFLAAAPIAALWGLTRRTFGKRGEIALVALLALPLFLMASNNYREYFQKQARDFASWAEFSTPESFIGKAISRDADAFEYFLSPRYYNHYTILFLGYFEQDHTHPLSFPESVLPGQAPPGRGLFYAFEEGRTGVLDVIRNLYPEGIEEPIVGTNGVTVVTFYRVPAAAVDAKRGLSARTDSPEAAAIPSFPSKFPAGPFHGVLTGSLYIDQAADYRFTTRCNGRVSWWISGKAVTDQASFHLIKGFHSVKFKLDTDGDPSLELTAVFPGGRTLALDSKRFSTISPSRGLKAFFYNSQDCTGDPAMVLWDPVINYVNGNDFPYHGGSAHWTGTLRVSQNGDYRFLAQTNDEAGLKIDHQEVIPLKSNGSGSVFLTKGTHSLDVYYSRPGNGWSNFTLLWSQPQNPRMEVLPNRVFGEVQ